MKPQRFSGISWRQSPLSRRSLDLDGLAEERQAVEEVCRRVRLEGDAAIREFGSRFDGWEGLELEVTKQEVENAGRALPEEDLAALEFAAERIRTFHEAQRPHPEVSSNGLRLLIRPVQRAGLYIPGGRASYPSTVLMTGIPARVAGVREVVLSTPPARDGSIPAPILAAARIAGVDRVFRVGGAQAIAALAYGSESVPRCDVVVGPGNIYVTLAKREVFGSVGLDAIAGPTEILILADDSAPAAFMAADLASQLEHDPMAWAILVTDSPALADAVEAELTGLLEQLDRAEVIAAAHCCIVVVDSTDEGMEIANAFGPEHLELVLRDGAARVEQVENAGAVFVGPYAAVSLGDYVVGTNHTLPTAGSARFSSPLGVHNFLKRTSVAELDRADLEMLREPCEAMARLEGLTAHAHAVHVRAGG